MQTTHLLEPLNDGAVRLTEVNVFQDRAELEAHYQNIIAEAQRDAVTLQILQQRNTVKLDKISTIWSFLQTPQ